MSVTQEALYLRYRPKRFQDVVEQDAVKRILSEELKTGRLKRCLLFAGSHGCGKTTNARIFATEVEPVVSNIVEINCADNTGVEDVRRLIIESSKSKPLVGTYKIYILDEVHMLTVQSQNALLKVLEEPPAHCIFILCTTDPQKILGTILSRAFRYDFQLISHQGIVDRLNYILTEEQKQEINCGVQSWDMDSLHYIATASGGHMRDAINILQKVIGYDKNVNVQNVEKVLGVTSYELLFNILNCILSKNETGLLQHLDNLCKSGMDLKLFIKNFLQFVLDVNKYVILKTETNNNGVCLTTIPQGFLPLLANYNNSHRESLKSLLMKLIELNSSCRWETNLKPVLETNLLLEVL